MNIVPQILLCLRCGQQLHQVTPGVFHPTHIRHPRLFLQPFHIIQIIPFPHESLFLFSCLLIPDLQITFHHKPTRNYKMKMVCKFSASQLSLKPIGMMHNHPGTKPPQRQFQNRQRLGLQLSPTLFSRCQIKPFFWNTDHHTQKSILYPTTYRIHRQITNRCQHPTGRPVRPLYRPMIKTCIASTFITMKQTPPDHQMAIPITTIQSITTTT